MGGLTTRIKPCRDHHSVLSTICPEIRYLKPIHIRIMTCYSQLNQYRPSKNAFDSICFSGRAEVVPVCKIFNLTKIQSIGAHSNISAKTGRVLTKEIDHSLNIALIQLEDSNQRSVSMLEHPCSNLSDQSQPIMQMGYIEPDDRRKNHCP